MDGIGYTNTWNNLLDMLYELDGNKRAILNKNDILYVCRVSSRGFTNLKKDGDELPYGFKSKGVWFFSIDSVVKWLMRDKKS